jgi:hypothetical protein
MTRKNLAVGEMESEREPMLRGGKRESTDKGSRKEEEKAAYINRGEMSPFVFLVASPPLHSPAGLPLTDPSTATSLNGR